MDAKTLCCTAFPCLGQPNRNDETFPRTSDYSDSAAPTPCRGKRVGEFEEIGLCLTSLGNLDKRRTSTTAPIDRSIDCYVYQKWPTGRIRYRYCCRSPPTYRHSHLPNS